MFRAMNHYRRLVRMQTDRLVGRLRALSDDSSGVSAVEFALLLPVMITLYLGTVEISQGIAADRKVSLTARTAADLVSQVASVNNSDMTNVLSATSTVIQPFASSNLKVVVSSVKIDANGTATIEWSDTLNGTARAKGSTVSLPTALKVPNSYLIWSEVQYAYKPTIGYLVSGTLTLKDQIYMRPRLSDFVDRKTS
jgi:Flp pilus assembly protein TadG